MPQLSGKPLPVRPVIDATVPGENESSPVKNISAQELARRKSVWNAQAEARRVAVEKETRTPVEATAVFKFQIKRFGKHYNSYTLENNRWIELLPSPSLLSSAVDALYDEMFRKAME
jgi:hypothetical protein